MGKIPINQGVSAYFHKLGTLPALAHRLNTALEGEKMHLLKEGGKIGGFFIKVQRILRLDPAGRLLVTNFLGFLEAGKCLKNNGALSPISKDPFILGIFKKLLLAMEISDEMHFFRLSVLNACWICLHAKYLHLQICAFKVEGDENKKSL